MREKNSERKRGRYDFSDGCDGGADDGECRLKRNPFSN